MTSAAYSRRFDEAVALAMDAFRPIIRKGSGVPYVTHLFSVTALVGEYGGDEEQLIAAMLHDYVEDIPGATVEALSAQFGERVGWLVAELSDCDGEPKPPWRERKEAYIAHLRDAPAEVKLISCADKLHNAITLVEDHVRLGDALYDRFRGKKDGTLWYYREVCLALGHAWESPMLDRLCQTVDHLHRISGAAHAI